MNDRLYLMIHVVIPCKNPPIELRETLEILSRQRTHRPVEISLVDSGSKSGTVDYLRKLCEKFGANFIEIPASEFSHSGTRNMAALRRDSEFTMFLTQDSTPIYETWIEEMIQPFSDPDVVGAFGRHVARPHHSEQTAQRLRNHFRNFESWEKSKNGNAFFNQENHFFSNNNSVVRSSFFKNVPFPGVEFGDDQAWCKLAHQADKKIGYLPDAPVYHSHEYSLLDRFRRSVDEGNHLSSIKDGRVVERPLEIYFLACFRNRGLINRENRLMLLSTFGYQMGASVLGGFLVKSTAFSFDKRLRDGRRDG